MSDLNLDKDKDIRDDEIRVIGSRRPAQVPADSVAEGSSVNDSSNGFGITFHASVSRYAIKPVDNLDEELPEVSDDKHDDALLASVIDHDFECCEDVAPEIKQLSVPEPNIPKSENSETVPPITDALNLPDVVAESADTQIRVLGSDVSESSSPRNWKRIAVIFLCVAVVVLLGCVFFLMSMMGVAPAQPVEVQRLVDEEARLSVLLVDSVVPDSVPVVDLMPGYLEEFDTIINDIPLSVYIPHNATVELVLGKVDEEKDTTILYARQAADCRADNGEINCSFVLAGEPIAYGSSQKGFCAIINGEITIGQSEDTDLFEKSINQGGYFFRQYPLVSNGELVENNPKNKSWRRSICVYNGEIVMIESKDRESFHDFSQALVDFGVSQAIALVGGKISDSAERRRGTWEPNYIVWKKRI